MSWLIDNAALVYLLIGLVALGFGTAFWLTRRVKFLVYAAAPLLVIGLFWLLTRFVVTDSRQIELNVNAMADAVVRRDADGLFKHISEPFQFQDMNRKQMFDAGKRALELHNVGTISISQFDVKELSRAKKSARADFLVRVDTTGGDTVMFALCVADFVLENDQWKLKGMQFFRHPGGQPFDIPLGR